MFCCKVFFGFFEDPNCMRIVCVTDIVIYISNVGRKIWGAPALLGGEALLLEKSELSFPNLCSIIY